MGVAQTVIDWSNITGSGNLTDGKNWLSLTAPNSTQIASFNLSLFPTGLHLQNTDWHVLGIQIGPLAGPITFDSSGGGSSKTIYVGSSGLLSQSLNTVSFNISTKVNLALDANASFTAQNGAIQINAGADFTLNSFTLTLDGANTTSYIEQAIDGNGGLVKTGTGTWTLSGANTYSGTSTIAQGTLAASSIVVTNGGSNFGNASSAVVLGGAQTTGTLSYTGDSATFTRGFTVSSGGGRLEVASSSATLTLAEGGVATSGKLTIAGAGSTTIASAISGAGSLAKSGDGTLTLSGVNTFTGGVSLSEGTLNVSAGATLASNSTPGALSLSGGTLNLLNTAQALASLAGTGGTLTLGSGHTLTLQQTGATSFGGVIAGKGSLVQSGSGTLTFSGVNTFSGGVTLNAGTLVVSTGAALAASGSKLTIDGGALSLDNTGQSLATLLLRSGALNGAGKIELTGVDSAWSGGSLAGTGDLTIAENAQLAINGAAKHEFFGRTIYNDGLLEWQAGDLQAGAAGGIVNRATFLASGSGTLDASTLSTATFTNNSIFKKTAGGTTTVGLAFTNTGTVSAAAGTLAFTNTFTNTGSVVLTGGAVQFASAITFPLSSSTLAGNGSVSAPIVTVGGILTPGNSAGALALSGDLTLLSTSTLIIELGGLSQGTDYDFVNVGGTAALGGTLSLRLLNGFVPAAENSFTILHTGTAIAGTFLGVPGNSRLFTSDGSGSFLVSYGSNDVVLSNFQAVPEPSTFVLLGVGALLVLTEARRRKNR